MEESDVPPSSRPPFRRRVRRSSIASNVSGPNSYDLEKDPEIRVYSANAFSGMDIQVQDLVEENVRRIGLIKDLRPWLHNQPGPHLSTLTHPMRQDHRSGPRRWRFGDSPRCGSRLRSRGGNGRR